MAPIPHCHHSIILLPFVCLAIAASNLPNDQTQGKGCMRAFLKVLCRSTSSD
ncbi:hypothetical protein C8J56DRAFT_1059940 [Mycena floridula]|nr:hypothetical protein C8J56DRAFT_1059940 [Mycena floridula]